MLFVTIQTKCVHKRKKSSCIGYKVVSFEIVDPMLVCVAAEQSVERGSLNQMERFKKESF